jgi:hypothetical protein
MRRIQQFLLCDNINKTIVNSLNESGINLMNRDNNSDAIQIKNGNFHWGFKK